MPVSSGLRSRPRIGVVRSFSARRRHVGGMAQLLPKALIAPIILVAGITALGTSLWTYDSVVSSEYAEADAPAVTGTVQKLN
jgi:hypothetical protein